MIFMSLATGHVSAENATAGSPIRSLECLAKNIHLAQYALFARPEWRPPIIATIEPIFSECPGMVLTECVRGSSHSCISLQYYWYLIALVREVANASLDVFIPDDLRHSSPSKYHLDLAGDTDCDILV